MTEQELYGPPARHSEYKPGDQVRYRDPEAAGGIDTGTIMYCCERQDDLPLSSMILPASTSFPCPVLASDIVEDPSTERHIS